MECVVWCGVGWEEVWGGGVLEWNEVWVGVVVVVMTRDVLTPGGLRYYHAQRSPGRCVEGVVWCVVGVGRGVR